MIFFSWMIFLCWYVEIYYSSLFNALLFIIWDDGVNLSVKCKIAGKIQVCLIYVSGYTLFYTAHITV